VIAELIDEIVTQDEVRLLRKGETIPSSLNAGLEQMNAIDPEWAWIVESGGEIKAVLLASPCHGAAFVARISVAEGMLVLTAGKLLRRFLADCRKRGIKGIITILDRSIETEARLLRILQRIQGKEFDNMTVVAAPVPEGFI
jgi:hypothetical protein